ncbi:MAG: DedA family protein [Parachlamydiaceae bacterium]|nr:DedA family protein [Parachlamydiaceae bacterium]
MECLPINETFSAWLIEYGSIVLFVFLVLGIIALPIPDETLMIFAGILMDTDKLQVVPTLLAAYSGSILGITFSYTIGRTVGHSLMYKYGKWIGLTPERLENVEGWLKKYGKWTLIFGYFIPGIRHFTGFATGMARLPYQEFALFAYAGAIIWATTFLSLGYFFGNYCMVILASSAFEMDHIVILGILILIGYLAYKFRPSKQNKID